MEMNALVLNKNDNVGTAIVDLQKGDFARMHIDGEMKTIKLRENVPFGFKISLCVIKASKPIIKYGAKIGVASKDIQPGMVVHVHNCEGARGRGDLSYQTVGSDKF
ncbi:MAG: UxaA family hydrolase [Veillonellales bacterium]